MWRSTALYLLTQDSAVVAFAATATFLPRVLLSAISGAAVDRFGVKPSLVAADLIQGAGAVGMARWWIAAVPPAELLHVHVVSRRGRIDRHVEIPNGETVYVAKAARNPCR